MELDWCVEEDVKNTQLFNDNSVISSKTKKLSCDVIDDLETEKDFIDITKCFDINIDCSNSNDLLNVLHYLSEVSNHLRTLIRNKGLKNFESNINYINQIKYVKYKIYY